MTLPSDSLLFKNNKQGSFRNKLPEPIQLSKEEWEVALAEIVIPSEVHNVSNEEGTFIFVTTDPSIVTKLKELNLKNESSVTGQFSLQIKIPAGAYTSPTHIVDEINDALQRNLKEFFTATAKNFSIKYSENAKRIKVASNMTNTKLEFSQSMYEKLGGDPHKIEGKDYAITSNEKSLPHDVDLYSGFNHLYFYSDIVEYTLCGDIKAPILRVIPFHYSVNRHIHHEFTNLHYVPLAKSYFDEVTINIYGESGNPVHFTSGKSLVKLHFRKKSKLNW